MNDIDPQYQVSIETAASAVHYCTMKLAEYR